ncbi:hypothetical protein D3C73_1161260 [compost metagenome]
MLSRHVRRAIDVDDRVLGVEHEQTRTRQARLDVEIGRRAVDLHFLVTKDFANHVVADIEPRQLHQFTTDGTVVDEHFQIAIGRAQ